jgi:ATP-dependent Clp protease ATP-binding subunit ClpA
VVLAQDAAREMGHPQIKPEHLLLALKDGEGMASAAMVQVGVEGAVLRQKVAELVKARPSVRKLDKVPFSSEGKKALELSLRAALELGHNYIGTEHIFLGVEREAEGRGQTLDGLLGASTAEVHNRLMDLVGGTTGAPSMRSPALQSAMNLARQRAGQAPMTTGHLLGAMVADTDSQAARALTSLGVTGEAADAALTGIPVADTSDATPSAPSVAITIGETTTVIGDARVAGALQQLNADQLRDAISKAIGLAKPDQAAG